MGASRCREPGCRQEAHSLRGAQCRWPFPPHAQPRLSPLAQVLGEGGRWQFSGAGQVDDALGRGSPPGHGPLPGVRTLPSPGPQPFSSSSPASASRAASIQGEPSCSSATSGCDSQQPHQSPRRNVARGQSRNPPPPTHSDGRVNGDGAGQVPLCPAPGTRLSAPIGH